MNTRTAPSRRSILIGAAGLPAALALESCAGQQTVPAVLQQAAQDVALLGNGLSTVVPKLSSLVDAGTVAKAQSWLGTITGAAAQLAQLPTTAAAQPIVQQVESAVNAILGVAAPLLAAVPTVGPILTAAAALLPSIESAVGLAVAMIPQAGGMSPDEARLVLAAAR